MLISNKILIYTHMYSLLFYVIDKTYIVDCTKRTFQDSVDFCSKKGYTIASFHSEHDIINAKTNAWRAKGSCNSVYIGGTSDGAGNWKWLDNSVWWRHDKTSDGLTGISETKLYWTYNDNWNDVSGTAEMGVICQKDEGTLVRFQFIQIDIC